VKRFDQSKKLLFNEENSCARVVQNISEFSWCEPDVQWQQNRSGFQNSVVGFEQAVAIGAEESDAVARQDAGLAQSPRKKASAIGKFRVRKAVPIADHRGSARVLLLRVAKEAQRRKGNVHDKPRLDQAD
jgi:hypothetical protein